MSKRIRSLGFLIVLAVVLPILAGCVTPYGSDVSRVAPASGDSGYTVGGYGYTATDIWPDIPRGGE